MESFTANASFAGSSNDLEETGYALATGVTLVSPFLTVIGRPHARIDLALNMALLTYLVLGTRLGWLPL